MLALWVGTWAPPYGPKQNTIEVDPAAAADNDDEDMEYGKEEEEEEEESEDRTHWP